MVAAVCALAVSLAAVAQVREPARRADAGELPTVVDALTPSVIPAYDGRYVTIRPPLGTYRAPLRVWVTRQEFEMSRRLEASTVVSPYGPVPAKVEVVWHVEPAAVFSATLRRQHRVWLALQSIVSRYAEVKANWHVDIVVARTQSYMNATLAGLGCRPDLSSQGGQVLMGATVCNRGVIVINLTGFLFLSRSTQSLTSAMESRSEPPTGSQRYLIVERNILGIAHEWVHVLRSAVIGTTFREEEPIWFREGYAHVMSLLARSKASGMTLDYLYAHVMALRYDTRQLSACPGSLVNYRTAGALVHGCGYILGALALEYLFAYYGGIAKLMTLFRLVNHGVTFSDAFRFIYGISMAEFEQRADGFIRNVRKASRR